MAAFPVGALLSRVDHAWVGARWFLQFEREICPCADAFLGYLATWVRVGEAGRKGSVQWRGGIQIRGNKVPGSRRGNCVDDHIRFLEILEQCTTNWVAQNNGSLSFHGSGSQTSDIKVLAGQCSFCNLWGRPSLLHDGFWWLAPNPWCSLACQDITLISASTINGILSTWPSSCKDTGRAGLGPTLLW